MIELNRIYNEDCIRTMDRMPRDFIDLVVTSPPYDGIRDFKEDDGAGRWDWNKFKETVCYLHRVMKEGGVIVWVISDRVIDGDENCDSFKQALYFRESGFKLHDTMIYLKRGGCANADITHYWNGFEYMFVFVKGKIKTANLLRDRKNRQALAPSSGTRRGQDGDLRKVMAGQEEFGRRTNVWTYDVGFGKVSKDRVAHDHPAIFPEALARDHIVSWTNEGDLVYDPFMGSGTTAKVAKQEKRNYIGSEVSKDYCDIADKRLHSILV